MEQQAVHSVTMLSLNDNKQSIQALCSVFRETNPRRSGSKLLQRELFLKNPQMKNKRSKYYNNKDSSELNIWAIYL